MVEKNTKIRNQQQEIDLVELAMVLLNRIWLIALAAILFGALAYGGSRLLIAPTYEASARMYVNNSTISVGSMKVSVSSADLTASQGLVETYLVIMTSRPTIETVIKEADLPYTYEQLVAMIDASAINDTEIFQITVTDTDPEEAALIANTLVKVLPDEIASIVDGCSARIVQTAVVPARQSAPNDLKNGLIGALAGAVLVAGILLFLYMIDDVIKDVSDVNDLTDIPILASIPDLSEEKRGSDYYEMHREKGKERD